MKHIRYGIEILLLGIALLALNGCGYKGPPTYEKTPPQGQNVAL